MNAGDLDRRVTLLRRVRGAQNGFGEASEIWTDVTTVWAQKLEVRDAERVQAQAVGVAISLRLRVRWSSATSAMARGDRVRFEGAVYSVEEIKEVGRRVGLEWSVNRIDESVS